MMGRTLIMIGIGEDGEAHVLGTSAATGCAPPESKFTDNGNAHRAIVACALIAATLAGGAEITGQDRATLGRIADRLSGEHDGH